MKKLALFAMTAATIMVTAGSPLQVQASAGNSVCQKLQKDGYVIIGGKVSSKSELNQILSKLETELKNGNWNCIPETCQKGVNRDKINRKQANQRRVSQRRVNQRQANRRQVNQKQASRETEPKFPISLGIL